MTSDREGRTDQSRDTLFNGAIVCRQPRSGYRYSIDAVLLAHFVNIRKKEHILDLGTGCGVIGLILLHRFKDRISSVVGYEKQENLVKIARQNVAENSLEDRFLIIQCIVEKIDENFQPESFSTVISNPPFYIKGAGRISRDPERETARHLTDTSLDCFIKAAAYCVKNKGKIVLIYPSGMLASLLAAMKKYRIEPKRLGLVYSYPEVGKEAKLAIVEGIKNGGTGLRVVAPFFN